MNLDRVIKSMNIPVYSISNITEYSEIEKELTMYNINNPLEFCSDDVKVRLDAKHILKDVKSVITLLLPYELENNLLIDQNIDIAAVVSNNAWQMDYHVQLKEKLSELANYLREYYHDLEYECVVDTSPLIDRRLAYKSALGSYGKNTFLINERLGTSFYIGSLLINKKLNTSCEQNQKYKKCDICLECDLCVKYCPGHALSGDYTIDSNKCISYLTQKKAMLSYEERDLISNRLYGCDICQKVCPYSKVDYQIHDEFKRNTSNVLDAVELIKTSNKKLRKIYKFSGFIWRGPNILKRNAIIIIANSKKESGLSFLINYFFEMSLEHRLYALWAIWKIDSKNFEDFTRKFYERLSEEELNEIENLLCIKS